MSQSTLIPQQETTITETVYCFSCSEKAIGLDEQSKPTCGGCEPAVHPFDTLVVSEKK